MAQLKEISVKQFIITISGSINSSYWTKATGGKVNREKVQVPDGRKGLSYNIPGMMTLEPITLTKPFDPVADKAIINWINTQVTTPDSFNLALKPVKADLAGSDFPGSSQILYPSCHLFDYKLPDADRGGSGVAMIEITIEPIEPPTYA